MKILVIGLLLVCHSFALHAASVTAYVGTYTSGKSQGIYRFQLDTETGAMTKPELAVKTADPSFLAIHPSQPFVYAVNETATWKDQQNSGGLSAFAINPDGSLRLLNDQPTQGAHPCHLSLDRTGKFVLVANYTGGSTISFPVTDSGSLGPVASFVQHTGASAGQGRQEAPHAHWVDVTANNQFALVADLGLDQVLVFRFDPSTGALATNNPAFAALPPGSGPRHFAMHPSQKFGYVINELNSTLTALTANIGRGRFQAFQTLSTLPEDFKDKNSTAELEMHPTGRFIYGSNRGHNSIVVFSIDQDSGRMTYVEHETSKGKMPRSFGIDPSGKFLLTCNLGSGSIASHRVDQTTGHLTYTEQMIEVPDPVCVRFVK